VASPTTVQCIIPKMKIWVLLVLLQLCAVFSIPARNKAAAYPTQVHLSYPGLIDQMSVTWISESPSDPSEVMYGTDPAKLIYNATGTATSYSYQGYTSGGIHYVLLSGLKVRTRYHYQVGGDGKWSAIFNFTTAPEIGKSGMIIGSTAELGVTNQSQITFDGFLAMKKEEGLDVVLHAGDISYADTVNPGGPVWDKYGESIEPLASYIPYNPGVGVHEAADDFTAFRLRYDSAQLQNNSKGGNFYYSFDYGNAHIIHLSSETDYSATSEQRKWLENDLKSINRPLTPWVMAVFHRPWYSSNTAKPDAEAMRVSLEPLLNQYTVDMAVAGYVHAYERTSPMVNGKVVTTGGTAHMTVGHGGQPLDPTWVSPLPAWSQYRAVTFGHCRLHIYNNTHAHWTMRLYPNKITDDFWFVKEDLTKTKGK